MEQLNFSVFKANCFAFMYAIVKSYIAAKNFNIVSSQIALNSKS